MVAGNELLIGYLSMTDSHASFRLVTSSSSYPSSTAPTALRFFFYPSSSAPTLLFLFFFLCPYPSSSAPLLLPLLFFFRPSSSAPTLQCCPSSSAPLYSVHLPFSGSTLLLLLFCPYFSPFSHPLFHSFHILLFINVQ